MASVGVVVRLAGLGSRCDRVRVGCLAALVVLGIAWPWRTEAAPFGAYLQLSAKTCADLLNRASGGAEQKDIIPLGFPDGVASTSGSVQASQLVCGFPLASSFPAPFASGDAYADLATGSIGIRLHATGIASYSDGIVVPAGIAQGQAGFWDTLHFHLEPGPEVAIEFSVTAEGSVSDGANGGSLSIGNVLSCSVSGCADGFGGQTLFLGGGTSTFRDVVRVFEHSEPVDLDVELNVGFFVGEQKPSVDFKDLDFDYFNTAAVSLVVPEGVTYTSTSGVFLTAVPEPSATALLALGAAALLALRSRRA